MSDARSAARFDIRDIPFSYYGSWFCVSPVTGQGRVAEDLHLVSHQTGMHAVLAFHPITRSGDRAQVEVCPWQLSWIDRSGRIDLVYSSPDTIRLRSTGPGLRIAAAARVLTPFSGTYLYRDPVDGAHVFTSYETGRRYRVTVVSGASAEAVGAEALGDAAREVVINPAGDSWEIAVEEYEAARTPYTAHATFAESMADAEAAFTAFLGAVAPWRGDHTPAADLAAYVLWSATVRPAGMVTRPAVLMSKHWMDKVWSWDHCFNALAVAEGRPALAWDQYQLPFDHQDETGALPDSVTHSELLYNYVKPPVHGWALKALRRSAPPAESGVDVTEVYRGLADWTRYWLDHRRPPGSDLAHYHHGNDSGWDNATTFDEQRVVAGPDLAAFLVLQLRELAALAPLAGRPDAARSWRAQADRMQAALLDQLWAGDRFAARTAASGHPHTTDSLLELMPIVLGELLPPEVHSRLAERARQHLTPHGLATELPSSPRYEADGYWRGPVWAPATVLIEDGLRRAGHSTLADEISVRFRTLCETSGFAENFDALTGEGQRDRAYTWTASGYLILASAAEQRRTAGNFHAVRGTIRR
ncbi:MAG TPA: trehalase family glycosidase [Pseudonocardiaceae bacterium]|nr:trehalase family glycosidase [Pseudonocardiaceae bacterium]